MRSLSLRDLVRIWSARGRETGETLRSGERLNPLARNACIPKARLRLYGRNRLITRRSRVQIPPPLRQKPLAPQGVSLCRGGSGLLLLPLGTLNLGDVNELTVLVHQVEPTGGFVEPVCVWLEAFMTGHFTLRALPGPGRGAERGVRPLPRLLLPRAAVAAGRASPWPPPGLRGA